MHKEWKEWMNEAVWWWEYWGQFHQHFTRSFYTHRSQKRKKNSQLKQLVALLGSASVKAACKHFDEIDPSFQLAARKTMVKLTLGCVFLMVINFAFFQRGNLYFESSLWATQPNSRWKNAIKARTPFIKLQFSS